jgi:hypothetical protein
MYNLIMLKTLLMFVLIYALPPFLFALLLKKWGWKSLFLLIVLVPAWIFYALWLASVFGYR